MVFFCISALGITFLNGLLCSVKFFCEILRNWEAFYCFSWDFVAHPQYTLSSNGATAPSANFFDNVFQAVDKGKPSSTPTSDLTGTGSTFNTPIDIDMEEEPTNQVVAPVNPMDLAPINPVAQANPVDVELVDQGAFFNFLNLDNPHYNQWATANIASLHPEAPNNNPVFQPITVPVVYPHGDPYSPLVAQRCAEQCINQ